MSETDIVIDYRDFTETLPNPFGASLTVRTLGGLTRLPDGRVYAFGLAIRLDASDGEIGLAKRMIAAECKREAGR